MKTLMSIILIVVSNVTLAAPPKPPKVTLKTVSQDIANLALKVDALKTAPRTECPSGMVLLGAAGSAQAFCMDESPHASEAYGMALGICKNLGKKLCTPEQFAGACQMQVAHPGVMDGYQWILGPIHMSVEVTGAVRRYGNLYGTSGCENFSTDELNQTYPFRCCLE